MGAKRYTDLADRIIANSVLSIEHYWVDPATGESSPCWEWVGKTVASRTGSGRRYPVLSRRAKGRGPRNVRVHRAVLAEIHGVRMTRVHVAAHQCNNCCCVNPMHLRRDTGSGNMVQCVREGRHNSNVANDFEFIGELA